MKKTQLFLVIVLFLLANSIMFARERYVEDTPMPKFSHRASINVTDMNNGVTAQDLVNKLSGGGIVISNIVYTGENQAAGTFSGGTQAGIGINEGIILSTGAAANAVGPNTSEGTSRNHGRPGDDDLDTVAGYTGATHDACILEFDFIPDTENLQFTFVMGSDEYEEWLNYHDVFGFFLNGVNIALIPGTTTPISIGTINPNVNPSYYISNDSRPGPYDIECDGFTIPISINATVIPNETNHIKLAVADFSDELLDTWIFIAAETFISGYNVCVNSDPQGAHIFKDGVDTGLTTPDCISQVTGTTSVYHVEMDGYTWIPTSETVANIQSDQEIFFTGTPDEVTPVELSSFTATISAQNNVALTWVTETETGMRGYYVHRAEINNLANAQTVSPLIASSNSSQQHTYHYEDAELQDSGPYYYWLEASDLDGSTSFHGPVSVLFNAAGENSTPEIPLLTQLHSVYPNPFNPMAFIPFSLAKDSAVNIKIYNSRGQMVKHFELGAKAAGMHRISWDGTDYNGKILSNGVYNIVMNAGKDSYQTKAVLLK